MKTDNEVQEAEKTAKLASTQENSGGLLGMVGRFIGGGSKSEKEKKEEPKKPASTTAEPAKKDESETPVSTNTGPEKKEPVPKTTLEPTKKALFADKDAERQDCEHE